MKEVADTFLHSLTTGEIRSLGFACFVGIIFMTCGFFCYFTGSLIKEIRLWQEWKQRRK